jgi:hypothetical protein
MIYFSFFFFHHIPSGLGQKCTYTHLVFGSIAFKLINLGQTFHVAFHKFPTISWVNCPIPPDIAGVTESGL